MASATVRKHRLRCYAGTAFAFLFLLSLSATAQERKRSIIRRYIDHLINDTTDISKPQFLAYPTIAFAPETSWEFGVSALMVYYTKRDTSNRLSELNGFGFYTLQNQYGAFLEHALYTHRNKWSFLGRLEFQDFPINYHGIGPNTPKEPLAVVEGRQLQFRERVLRNLGKKFFTGVELDYQRLNRVRFVPENGTTVLPPAGAEGSSNLGIGVGLLFDKRHNVLNVRDGAFSELAFLRYDRTLGSDYDFTYVVSDSRWYKPVGKRNVLAAQLLGQFNFGNTPFNQLARLGGMQMMRGYYAGRFRDRHQLATQVEYRMLPLPFPFTKRIGAAFFASTGTVFPEFKAFSFSDLKFAAGAGLRYYLFPKKDIFSRVDVAFTKEGPGFYFIIGEAF